MKTEPCRASRPSRAASSVLLVGLVLITSVWVTAASSWEPPRPRPALVLAGEKADCARQPETPTTVAVAPRAALDAIVPRAPLHAEPGDDARVDVNAARGGDPGSAARLAAAVETRSASALEALDSGAPAKRIDALVELASVADRARSQELMFWRYGRVLAAYGRPDEIWPSPETTLHWIYELGNARVEIVFYDGFVIQVH